MWNIKTEYCEINGQENGQSVWDYVAQTHGLKQYMTGELVSAVYGQFEVIGSAVEYRQYIGTVTEIKTWNIVTGCNSEMLDDIEWLKNGHCEIVF